MNTDLLSVTTSDANVTLKAVSSHTSSTSSTEPASPDSTPDFAGVLAIQATSQQTGNASAIPGTAPVSRRDASAQNTVAPDGHHPGKSHPDHHGSRAAQLLHPHVSVSSATQPPLQLVQGINTSQHSGLPGALEPDIDATSHSARSHAGRSLPERFSQIIATLSKGYSHVAANNIVHDNHGNATIAAGLKEPSVNGNHLDRTHESKRGTRQHMVRTNMLSQGRHNATLNRPELQARTVTDHDQQTSGKASHAAGQAVSSMHLWSDVHRHDTATTSNMHTETHAGSLAGPAITSLAASGFIPAPVQGTNVMPLSSVINQPLSSPQWASEMGRQFVSLIRPANNGGHRAELRLDPPELGPLRITINLNDSVVQAVFTSPHAMVRNAVEHALPQLQQHLEQEGLSLGHASVDHDDATPANHSHNSDSPATALQHEPDTTVPDSLPARPRISTALVDTFA